MSTVLLQGYRMIKDRIDGRPEESGAPTTVRTEATIKRLRILVHSDSGLTIRMLSIEFNIEKWTIVYKMLTRI